MLIRGDADLGVYDHYHDMSFILSFIFPNLWLLDILGMMSHGLQFN